MNDLRTMLHEAAGPLSPSPDPQFADALLARGQRAARRRRIGRLTAGSGLATVAVLSAMLVLFTGGWLGTASPVELVAYTGKQPVGFTLDKVPAKWHIQFSDPSYLLLAPDDMRGASKDVQELGGKVYVSLMVTVPEKIAGVNVQVNGRPGVIFENAVPDYQHGPATHTLYVKQPRRLRVLRPCQGEQLAQQEAGAAPEYLFCGTAKVISYLAIQVPGELGWSNDRIVDFANGIHITKDSKLMSPG